MAMDRRSSLQAIAAGGIALGAHPAIAGTALAGRAPISVVIYDGRYADCVAFAKARRGKGVLLVDTFQRDIGLAWREEIARQLAAHPGQVEGLSLYADHFVSALMARDHGLRLTHDDRVAAREDQGPSFFQWTLG